MPINGSHDEDAARLFPHSRLCNERMRTLTVIQGKPVACSCRASARRASFLILLRRAKRQAYVDAYARIRHAAKNRIESSTTPQEKAAFEEVAAWAESLEFGALGE